MEKNGLCDGQAGGFSPLFFLCYFCCDPLYFLHRWREAIYLHVGVSGDTFPVEICMDSCSTSEAERPLPAPCKLREALQ